MRLLQEDDCFSVDSVLYDAPPGKRCSGGGARQPRGVPGDDLRRGASAPLAGAQPQLSQREVVEE
eukprot:4162101-Lingulodinium_polyedra.AAC.1